MSVLNSRTFLLAIPLPFLLSADVHAQEALHGNVPESVRGYLKEYCFRCHGPTAQKGDRRLDLLPKRIAPGSDQATLVEEALDAINRGDMPPAKAAGKRPSADETRVVVAALTAYLSSLSEADSKSSTTLRRLNRFEYINTMRDLLGLRREFFDFTSDFPLDATEDGFDNNGNALTLSDYQLHRYLEVAEVAVDAASFFGVQQPRTRQWSFTGKDFNGVNSYERAPVTWRLIVDDKYVEIGHGQPSERHANFVPAFVRKGGVPADGWYTVEVKAAAANRLNHGYTSSAFDRFKNQRLKMALWIAPNAALLDKNAADQRQLVKVRDLPDETPKVFRERIQLRKGAIPFVSWTNGVSSKGTIRRVAEQHHPEVIRATTTQRDAAKLGDPDAKELVARLAKNVDNKLVSDVYRGPRMRVWGMNIEGPHVDQWPPANHRLLFGIETDASKIDIEAVVRKFATRAFRRPVKPAEVQHYVDFVHNRIREGESNARAIQLGLAAVLTSPRFLYLDEGNEDTDTRLTLHELASRLSYFLWSSLPDEELATAATSGELANDNVLKAQVLRMLQDSKADAFVQHFTDTWLRINTLGSMPPDPKAFEAYYRDRLEELFKTETAMFFGDLLRTNGSIVNLLDSDCTFCNDVLAQHYGISGVRGEHFRRVSLMPEHRRGGLLGQGSVLTLTANGIETSPVVRGVWVLENILGTPPAPPPPDIEPFEPDTRGTTTIREQLNKHRSDSTCADCHQKIDPVGFALEFFDPIGGFRTRYPGRGRNSLKVDGFGKLPSGETFRSERDLKALLIQRRDQFSRTLAEKLLTYATGRSMTFRDRQAIERVARECSESGYGLRSLVVGVATSETFRRR